MREALAESRALFRTPEDFLGRLRCLIALHRFYVVDCAGDQVPKKMVAPYRLLLKEGRIVWGCFAQANRDLFRAGSADLPANVVYSTDPYFDDQPKELSSLSFLVYDLKHKRPDESGKARMAGFITNEYSQPLHEPLTREMTGGRAVFFSTTVVHRRQLPTGFITGRWFPLLICPEKTPMNLILPLRYWSPRIVQMWQEGKPENPVESGILSRYDAGMKGNYSSATVPAEAPESLASIRARYEANPLQLTGKAAAATHRILRENGGGPRYYLHIYTETGLEVGRVKYGVALDVKTLKPGDIEIDSSGIRIVAEGRSLQHLVGKVVDYREGPMSSGFMIVDADL